MSSSSSSQVPGVRTKTKTNSDNDNDNDNDNHKAKVKLVGLDLPAIPYLFQSCDYKHQIEFDPSLHYLEKHKPELFRLPIGKGSMECRADYAVELAKQRLTEAFQEEESEGREDDQ